MPTYDYVCDACGHAFEEFQSITADHLTKCPACKKKKLRRLLGTGGAIIFKGSGFYITDYRSDSYKKAEKADSSTPSTSSTSESTKTPDASSPKPESKTPAKPATSPKPDKPKK